MKKTDDQLIAEGYTPSLGSLRVRVWERVDSDMKAVDPIIRDDVTGVAIPVSTAGTGAIDIPILAILSAMADMADQVGCAEFKKTWGPGGAAWEELADA